MRDEARFTSWMILIAGLLEAERAVLARATTASGFWRRPSAAEPAESGPQEVELPPVGRTEPLGPFDA